MIVTDIRAQAAGPGFSAVGITRPEVSAAVQARFDAMVAAGAFGDMSWMATTAARRRDPAVLGQPRAVSLCWPKVILR